MPDAEKNTASSENPAAYGLVQLRDLPDAAIAGGFAETMEARFAREALGCAQGGVSLQRVKPGLRASFAHRHTRDEEIYVVVAGSGRMIVDGQVIDLQPWNALRITPGCAHSYEAGADGLEFLVFRPHHPDDQGEFAEAGWPD